MTDYIFNIIGSLRIESSIYKFMYSFKHVINNNYVILCVLHLNIFILLLLFFTFSYYTYVFNDIVDE